MNRAETQAKQSLQRLKDALRAAFKAPGKEKSIHDLRVAIRRFKQVLRVYNDQFEKTRRMKRELSGLLDECGAARNCDIAEAVMEAAGVPANPAMKRALKKRRADATRKLRRGLKDWQDRTRMRRWSRWLTPAADQPMHPPAAPKISGEFLKSGAEASQATATVKRMHRFRLLVKKTRYAAEILGGPASHIEALRDLQDRLGAVNDCATTADLIADLKLEPADKRRFKAALNRLAMKRAAEFRIFWREHFAPGKAAVRRTK